jgi:hypothetical protein
VTEFVSWLLFGAGAAVWLAVLELIDAWRALGPADNPTPVGAS